MPFLEAVRPRTTENCEVIGQKAGTPCEHRNIGTLELEPVTDRMYTDMKFIGLVQYVVRDHRESQDSSDNPRLSRHHPFSKPTSRRRVGKLVKAAASLRVAEIGHPMKMGTRESPSIDLVIPPLDSSTTSYNKDQRYLLPWASRKFVMTEVALVPSASTVCHAQFHETGEGEEPAETPSAV